MSATTTRTMTIALAGNPNCGKTTVFNGLTGSTARVGNWPGVTVERREGLLAGCPREVTVVDLPGVYSLAADSEDEKIARDFLLSGNVDLVVNIVDASNLERNLYLSSSLLESGIPVVVALNMMDMAAKIGLDVDCGELSARLGCPVIPLSAVRHESFARFKKTLVEIVAAGPAAQPHPRIRYDEQIEGLVEGWIRRLAEPARELGVNERRLALGLLEGDPFFVRSSEAAIDETEVRAAVLGIEERTGTPIDMLIADSRYRWIGQVCAAAMQRSRQDAGSSGRLDSVLMNRVLGIPIFFAVMYLVFWTTMSVGGAFIDFFDILFGGFLVDGLGNLLGSLGSPDWLTSILAGGIGGGIQTVSTFVPIIFTLFLMLAILEDSGYMARAAFVMDRAMNAIGLPGKAFVPMLVGFGCTVPAIMATRTLESERDRFLAIFMTPFMSCGARLPVYALFTAAFFGLNSGAVVFSIYMVGIVLAVITGLLLKNTVLRGEHSPFVMELPPYHAPRVKQILTSAWRRLGAYIFRAGKVIILVVVILSVLNSLGVDGSWGNEDTDNSVLAAVGKTITPVFTPLGIGRDNWQATVGLFTGIFAKEAVVGTLNSLYRGAAVEEAAEDWSLAEVFRGAFTSIGENLGGVLSALADPFGLGLVSGEEEKTAEELGTDAGVFTGLREHFTPVSAYAYLLFVLIYFPCVAALGVAIQETGSAYGTLLMVYLTILAWIVATLFYQVMEAGQALWIVAPLLLLAAIVLAFAIMGRRRQAMG